MAAWMVLRLVDGLTTGFAVRLLVQWTGWGKERSIWSMVVWLLTDESPDYGSGLALLLAGWLSSGVGGGYWHGKYIGPVVLDVKVIDRFSEGVEFRISNW